MQEAGRKLTEQGEEGPMKRRIDTLTGPILQHCRYPYILRADHHVVGEMHTICLKGW